MPAIRGLEGGVELKKWGTVFNIQRIGFDYKTPIGYFRLAHEELGERTLFNIGSTLLGVGGKWGVGRKRL